MCSAFVSTDAITYTTIRMTLPRNLLLLVNFCIKHLLGQVHKDNLIVEHRICHLCGIQGLSMYTFIKTTRSCPTNIMEYQ